jgi:superfamily I DNA and/or RNA helicase
MTFARVLLDEAAQATELSSLVPLMKMKPEACVTLVGDHRQLPPTISNVQVDVEGFGTSLFERMAGQGVQPYLLNIQYRMHPCISAFPSSMCLGCGSQGHDAHDDSDAPSETFVPKQDAVCGCI